MKRLSVRFFEEPVATDLEYSREGKRERHRIVYDCFNALVIGDRVECCALEKLGRAKDSRVTLLSVLRGQAASTCQKCEVYETEKEGN